MASGPERIHDVAASEGADRAALALAFLFGAGGSLFLKLEALRPFDADVPPAAAAVWAAIVLVGYVIAVWRIGRLRIEPETIGDNCYYLGFVFTLTSLAVTLYEITGETIGASALQATISEFGIALSSTIVGIVLRVWLMRLRPDIVARNRAARIELQTAARDFRAALATSATIVKSHAVETTQLMAEERAQLLQIVQETIATHRVAMKKGVEVQLSALERTMAKGADKSASAIATAVERALDASAMGMTEAVAEIRANLADFTAKEAETLKRLVSDAGTLSKSGADADAAMTEVAHRLVALAAQLDTAAAEAAIRIEAAAEAIERGGAEVTARIRTGFEALSRAAEEVGRSDHLERASRAIEETAKSIEATSTRLAASDRQRVEQIEGVARALSSAVTALETATRRLAEVSSRVGMIEVADRRPEVTVGLAPEPNAAAARAAAMPRPLERSIGHGDTASRHDEESAREIAGERRSWWPFGAR